MKAQHYFSAFATLLLAFSFNACSENERDAVTDTDSMSVFDLASEKGMNPDDLALNSNIRSQGYVYTEGNETGTNILYVYRQNTNGSLTLQETEASGGSGNGMLLDSQGALAFDAKRDFLYAVNAGDNSVSSFKVERNGNLTLMQTALTGGITPVSVTVDRRVMYVVHAGSSDISGFHLGAHGSFSFMPGSTTPLSTSNAGPAQISFSPNGDYLYVTEKMTNKITSFHLDSDDLPDSVTSITSTGNTPFGFDFARSHYMIVSNAEMGTPDASTVTSYSGINMGMPDDVNGAVSNGQSAACWVATTLHSRYAYVSNTLSDNLSSYYIGPNGELHLLIAAIPAGDAPIDLTVSSNDRFVYVLNSGDHTIHTYLRTRTGGLELTGITANIPASAAGLIAW